MNPIILDEQLQKMVVDKPKVLPELVKNRVDSTLAALPEKRKNNRVRTFAFATSAAAVLAVSMIGVGFVSPTMASALRQIPGVDSVFRIAGDFGLKTADQKRMITDVSQSVTDQGITVSICEVMYDGARLSIGYIQESPNGIQEIKDVDYQINSKNVHFPSSSTGNRIDDRTYAGVVNLIPENELPDHFQLKMTVNKMGDISGKWEFSFPVEKMASHNKSVIPMITKTSGNTSLTIKKIVFTPTSTEMDVEIKQPAKSYNEFMNYEMSDDKGTVLEPYGGSGSGRTVGDFEVTEFKQRFGPVKDIPKSVTIRPIVQGDQTTTTPKETRVLMDHSPDTDHPIVLSQGDMGVLKITQVQFLKDKTLVHYQAEGLDPHAQANPLWIEDQSGKKYLLLDKPTQLVDQTHYQFVREFPAFSPNEKLTFVSKELPKPSYEKELEMSIPVLPNR